jgi:hypothetical protein
LSAIVASGEAETAPLSLITVLCGSRWPSFSISTRPSIAASGSPHQLFDITSSS